jgi:hypothetical protein
MPDSVILVPNERIIERGRGCWNCTHFDNGTPSRQLWFVHRSARVAEAKAKQATAFTPDAREHAAQRLAMIHGIDKKIMAGSLGICTDDRANGDFVDHRYLCAGWTGKQGSAIATEGHAPDLLPGELKEKLGD